MNFRNRQIFGWRGFGSSRPKFNKIHVVSILVVVVLFSAIFLWFNQESSTTGSALDPSLTGAAVIQQQPIVEEETSPETETEEIREEAPPEPEEERVFYEYRGECARDMKSREDDINDINSQINEYNQQVQALQAEYDTKLAALKEEYQIPIDRANAKKTEAEEDLVNVEIRWAERKVFCDKKYPQ